MKRETTPFVFTKEMLYVLGGAESSTFAKFVDICGTAFNILRKNAHLLSYMLLLMIPAGMPELRERRDLNHLIQSLELELTDEKAKKSFAEKVDLCLKDPFKRLDNTFHIIYHRLKN